jgi:hypothetical protein
MKPAEELLAEIAAHVHPPHGLVIVLVEWKQDGKPNWLAASNLEGQASERCSEKLIALRKSDPTIDWSNVKFIDGMRRIALHIEE